MVLSAAFSQKRLEFRKRVLDGNEVGTIEGKAEQTRTGGFDGGSNAGPLVIVHDDDITQQ
jgi:hypothetical protein